MLPTTKLVLSLEQINLFNTELQQAFDDALAQNLLLAYDNKRLQEKILMRQDQELVILYTQLYFSINVVMILLLSCVFYRYVPPTLFIDWLLSIPLFYMFIFCSERLARYFFSENSKIASAGIFLLINFLFASKIAQLKQPMCIILLFVLEQRFVKELTSAVVDFRASMLGNNQAQWLYKQSRVSSDQILARGIKLLEEGLPAEIDTTPQNIQLTLPSTYMGDAEKKVRRVIEENNALPSLLSLEDVFTQALNTLPYNQQFSLRCITLLLTNEAIAERWTQELLCDYYQGIYGAFDRHELDSHKDFLYSAAFMSHTLLPTYFSANQNSTALLSNALDDMATYQLSSESTRLHIKRGFHVKSIENISVAEQEFSNLHMRLSSFSSRWFLAPATEESEKPKEITKFKNA